MAVARPHPARQDAPFAAVTPPIPSAGGSVPRGSPDGAWAEHDLGIHRFDGTIDIIWTDALARRSGHWVDTYTVRGHLDPAEEGEETLLAGWSLHGRGAMRGTDERVLHDVGTCMLTSGAAHIFARFSAEPGIWGRGALRFSFFGGSGPYHTVRGEGAIERLMHLPSAAPVGWGFLRGAVAWRRSRAHG